jgi:hypothetical protein
MQDRPTAPELVAAVRGFLEHEIAPNQRDQRLRFRTLVAINALTILQRELEQEEGLVRDEVRHLARLLGKDMPLPERPEALRALALELNTGLAIRIRRGEAPDGTLEHIRRVGAAKLRIASPRYLRRCNG